MFKQAHRVFITFSKKVSKDVMLHSSGFVNNNFLKSNPAISKVSLSALTYNITKRYYTEARQESDSDTDTESDMNKVNPSVEVQKQLEQKSQEKLDSMLANDPKLNKVYKVLELEIELLRQSGIKIPGNIRSRDWLELLKLKSHSSRRRFLQFLWTNEIKRKNYKLKKKEFEESREVMKDEEENHQYSEDKYGLRNNTMFTRIYKSTMNEVMNKKLINAIMFGEKLVIDCGFESHMNYKEISSCAKQLMFAYVANRDNKEPFDIHLCNLDPKGELKQRLLSFFPTMNNNAYPLNTTSQSYLELFPKKNLVYLTPHTSNVLTKYNPDDIYIIGGIVDKVDCKPLSIAKAKEEQIRVAKFPLENYLDWRAGSGKSLNLNHCVEIMLNIKNNGDWKDALKVIPQRKIITSFNHSNNNRSSYSKVSKSFKPKFQSARVSHQSSFSSHKSIRHED